MVCVTIDQRVLFWDSRTRGAREIIENLETGHFCFGSAGESALYILTYAVSTKILQLYEVNPELNYSEITKLPDTLAGITNMVFEDGTFYIKSYGNLYSIDAATGKVYPGKDMAGIFNNIVERNKNRTINVSYFKRHINDGYTTINTVKHVYINGDGELGFDDRHIGFKSFKSWIAISIDHNSQEENKNLRVHKAIEMDVPYMGIANTTLKFSRFVWADGSEMLADSRGLLHLRSADKNIPEITIVMIMGRLTACWAADGRVCGSSYFTGVDTAESREAREFYYNYIQRFIDRIAKYGTVTEI